MKKINTIIVSEIQPPTTDVLWINDNKLSYFGKGTWKTIENNTESKDSKEQLDIIINKKDIPQYITDNNIILKILNAARIILNTDKGPVIYTKTDEDNGSLIYFINVGVNTKSVIILNTITNHLSIGNIE